MYRNNIKEKTLFYTINKNNKTNVLRKMIDSIKESFISQGHWGVLAYLFYAFFMLDAVGWEMVIRMGGWVAFTIFTPLATKFTKDYYEFKIKPKFFNNGTKKEKTNKKGSRKNDKENVA